MSAVIGSDARAGNRGRALLGFGIGYILLSATICALTGASRPLVLPSDILTGWATLPRNMAAFAYQQASGTRLGALAEDPAVLVMDMALTTVAAVINVLVVGGTYLLIRTTGHAAQRTKMIVGGSIALLLALVTTAALSTVDPTAFYGALFRLPVD
jgi:non-ribosomal peptide synthetase component F